MLRLRCRSRSPPDRQRIARGLRRFADDNSSTATGLCTRSAAQMRQCSNCFATAEHCTVQVITGAHSFTYDHVFGADSTPPDQLYGHCVEPLVSGLFKGYNATGVCRLLHELSKASKQTVVRKCVTKCVHALQSIATSTFARISKCGHIPKY